LAWLLRKIADEEFEHLGLTYSYAFLIMAVYEQPGITPTDLSEKLFLSPSTITRLIEKLETKDLIYREIKGRYSQVFPGQLCVDFYPQVKKAWGQIGIRYATNIGFDKTDCLNADIREAIAILK
jgi:DNA-binding transcriptional ArsR family regulator